MGACLADDMGLGKTVQAIAVILQRAADGPTLVVAPKSVSLNWFSETYGKKRGQVKYLFPLIFFASIFYRLPATGNRPPYRQKYSFLKKYSNRVDFIF